MRIELERRGDAGPGAVEHGGGFRAEQFGEIFAAQRETVGRIHLPDETEGIAAPACGGCGNGRRLRGGHNVFCLCRRGKGGEQGHRRAGAEADEGDRPGRDIAFGAAVERGLAGKPLGAERDQIALVAEAFARFLRRLDQFAIGGKYRRGPPEIGKQPLRAVGEAQILAGALGRYHQYRVTVVGKRDARAKADQRAAEARAETAQAFESRRAALRQRAGHARDLRGGGVIGFESERR